MKKVILPFVLCSCVAWISASNYFLLSPDKQVRAGICIKDGITLSVDFQGERILCPSPISVTLTDGTVWGQKMQIKSVLRKSIKDSIETHNYYRARIVDNYNEITFKSNTYNLVVRAYNTGVAYRFCHNGRESVLIQSEQASFIFPQDCQGYFPYVNEEGSFEQQYHNSFESYYEKTHLSELDSTRLIILPAYFSYQNGHKVLIMESDLLHYPGMYLQKKEGNTLAAHFAPLPNVEKQGGHNMLEGLVESYYPYIAEVDADESLPWRIIAVAANDVNLADIDLVYQLATPSQIPQTDWILPGKVAWDWWNKWNIKGVPFRSGINDETYKFYIDFASKFGIEYVILDEGWAVNRQADLMQVVPEIHLDTLIQYAATRHVRIILWAGYWAFNRDIEQICKHYAQMGIAGFKIDFMNRDDQCMVDFHRRAAQIAAKYHLLVDFHGTYKPAGIQRTYPNVINFEGVRGLEQMKWAEPTVDQVSYDVQIPFIRMVCGPMDYTQGAMRNATKQNYRPISSEPMSQGTRCHQLAEYIVFFSPLTMLCDAPTSYLANEQCALAISQIPTVWDETIILDGQIGEYIVTARRKGNTWYIGALNNWEERDISIDLTHLMPDRQVYTMEIFKDGINADKNGQDYTYQSQTLSSSSYAVHLSAGGGCLIKINKQEK